MMYQQFFIYENATSISIELILEPWGEVYIIKSGARAKVCGESKEFGGFEIHQEKINL